MKDKGRRIKYCRDNFMIFCLYYFSSSFHFPWIAWFHKNWCKAVEEWRNIYLEWFRESAKTLIIGIAYDIWCIVYKKKRFICAFSYEWKNANDYLFKIAVQLQTNERIINDFWQLFYWESNNTKQSQKKSISEFITENDIKLKAFSMGMSMRWQNFMSKDGMLRPDSLLFDDIDVLKSVQNINIIDDNFRFLEDEVFGWLADYCQIRVLGNVIKQDWLNPRLKEKAKKLSTWISLSQSIYDKDWNISWKRFVETDKEADIYNKDISDPKCKVISLESKLNELWQISYNQNYLLLPLKEWDKLFKQSYIRMFDEHIDYDYIEVGIDPAFSEKTKSDTFAITITGFKRVENVVYKYIEETIGLKWEDKNNQNICRTVLNVFINYRPRKIKVEKNNGWEVFAKMFRDPNLMWWYNLPIDVITSTKDKFTRAKEFEWCFQRWEVFFRVDKTDELIDQMMIFTGDWKEHDDYVDSMIFSFYDSWANFYFDIL